MATKTLFDMPQKTRAKRRVLMHVIDAGPDTGPSDPGDTDLVRLGCSKCGHETCWQRMLVTEAKRGMPCPKCNGGTF